MKEQGVAAIQRIRFDRGVGNADTARMAPGPTTNRITFFLSACFVTFTTPEEMMIYSFLFLGYSHSQSPRAANAGKDLLLSSSCTS